MGIVQTELTDHFSLNIVAPGLDGFLPPGGDFAPEGDWQASYGVYTLAGVCDRAGTLKLQRRAAANGRHVLRVSYEKTLPKGFVQKVAAKLDCETDALSTPRRWTYTTRIVSRSGESVPGTVLDKTAEAKNGAIEIAGGRHVRRVPVSGAYATNWALFEAVQRLPRGEFDPLHFTMFDDFDQVKPDQTLSFRKTADVVLGRKKVQEHQWQELEKGRIRKTTWAWTGGEPVRLHAYSQLGWGVVPWVYWVDDRGRLLFVVSGLEAYLMEPGRAS